MQMRKDQVEHVFRLMMLEYNKDHDFWCLPWRCGCPDTFYVKVYHQLDDNKVKWETQITIKGIKMDDPGRQYYPDQGIKAIQKIIQDVIDRYDKKRNRAKV